MTNKIKKRYNQIAKFYDILDKPMEMDAFNFIPLHLYGANINRETYDNLLKAGFVPRQIEIENVWIDIVKLIRINNKV